MKQLDLPREALESPEAVEFLRAWHDGGDIGFVSLGNIWDDPAQIGLFLADLLRHLVYASERNDEEKAADLSRAYQLLRAEIESPTE